jgi:hypothetical protein
MSLFYSILGVFLLLAGNTALAAEEVVCKSKYIDLMKSPPIETVGPSLTATRDKNGQGASRIEDPAMEIAYSIFFDWNNSDASIGFSTLSLK